MAASACALNQQVRAAGDLFREDLVTIAPDDAKQSSALHDEGVYDSLGVRVVFSEQVDQSQLQVDADVWYWDGDALVLGLNRAVKLTRLSSASEESHIRRINVAAHVTVTDTGAQIEFLSGGMMEVSVQGTATTDTPGWTVTQRDNETIFTKHGSAECLNLIF